MFIESHVEKAIVLPLLHVFMKTMKQALPHPCLELILRDIPIIRHTKKEKWIESIGKYIFPSGEYGIYTLDMWTTWAINTFDNASLASFLDNNLSDLAEFSIDSGLEHIDYFVKDRKHVNLAFFKFLLKFFSYHFIKAHCRPHTILYFKQAIIANQFGNKILEFEEKQKKESEEFYKSLQNHVE